MYVCAIAHLCLSFCDPTGCSPLGLFIHGISQARVLGQVAISYSRGSSQPRDQTYISFASCIGKQIFFLPLSHLGFKFFQWTMGLQEH